MKTIIVKSFKEGIEAAFLETQKVLISDKKLNVALPGGRFGKSFIEFLSLSKLNFENINFFLTDERITTNIREKNSYLLSKPLLNLFNFNKNSFFDFNDFQNTFKSEENYKLPSSLDLVYLSLGEDGHLAGHFLNSKNIGLKLCITENAPKPPPKRVSFKLEWLMESSKIIIVSLGKSKSRAADNLISGGGFHSKTILKFEKKITFISDNSLENKN